MKRSKLYELVECAFSPSALEEAICEAIEDFIDYEEVASELLDEIRGEIHDAAVAAAREYLDCPPF